MEILDFFIRLYLLFHIRNVAISFIAINVYFFIANKFNIFAHVNNRSLHSTQTITSAGIIMPTLLLLFFFIRIYIYK